MITITTLNDEYKDLAKGNFNIIHGDIRGYIPQKTYVFYVCAANSFASMGGGIDGVYRRMFPHAPGLIQEQIELHCSPNKHGDKYLPIGSSIIVPVEDKKYIVCPPTMLVPMNVQNTNNCYYATMAALKNILSYIKEFRINPTDVEIIFTSMCCGIGGMEADESYRQFVKGVRDWKEYQTQHCANGVLLAEPNKDEQIIDF